MYSVNLGGIVPKIVCVGVQVMGSPVRAYSLEMPLYSIKNCEEVGAIQPGSMTTVRHGGTRLTSRFVEG